MSMSYWLLEGVGICADEIVPHIENKKLAHMLLKEMPEDEELISIVKNKKYDELQIDEFLYGEPYDSVAEMLTFCDDTDSITYGDDGEGTSYFYYPPSMPWHQTDTEPQSLEEVHKRIINAVQKITSLSNEDIAKMIDDELYVVGFG